MSQTEIFFSVVIPAYNEPAGLRACLTALTHQSFPLQRFETIVVDDGSLLPLADSVAAFEDRLAVKYIRVRNGGAAAARNHGARAAKGRYLAFTDHDCAPAREWLSALSEGFAKHPDRMLAGPKVNGLPGNPYSSAHQIASNYAEEWFRAAEGAARYFTANNLAVLRERFLEIGGFDEALRVAHEERELAARWADRGGASAWIREAVVVHRHELTLFSFLRQQYRYGTGAIGFRYARSRSPDARSVRFEGLRFHFGLIAKSFAHASGARSLHLAALLAAAQAAYAAGVIVGAATGGRCAAG